MKAITTNKLKNQKAELLCKLFDSTNTKPQFIQLRSQYYQVSYDLYFMNKHKSKKSVEKEIFVLPIAVNY